MANNSKNNAVLGDVIKSLAIEASQGVSGICLTDTKRNGNAVAVCILPNEKVTVDISVNIEQGHTVPQTVASLQEKVKNQIEDATRFKVHAINVDVKGIIVG